MKIFEFRFEIEINVFMDADNADRESITILVPQIRGIRSILWEEYRFVEFESKEMVEKFKKHYEIDENLSKLSKDCQLFHTLLEIPGVKKVSIIGRATLSIEKETETEWSQINEAVKKAYCKFLDI